MFPKSIGLKVTYFHNVSVFPGGNQVTIGFSDTSILMHRTHNDGEGYHNAAKAAFTCSRIGIPGGHIARGIISTWVFDTTSCMGGLASVRIWIYAGYRGEIPRLYASILVIFKKIRLAV